MFRMRAARQERGRLAHVCINLGSTWAQRGRVAQVYINIGSTWRVALVCINIGSTWASRPRLHQPPPNVGESPTLLSPDQSLHSRGHFVSAQPHMLFAELKHVFL